MSDQSPEEIPEEEGLPEGSLAYGQIVITYFLTPDGDPIVSTQIYEDEQGNSPSYFEAVAMHAMAKDSIDKVYGVRS